MASKLTLEALLRKRYQAPEWAILFEVPNGTGANKSRSADALAQNLWPSRGMALHGFEVKSHRSDFLAELKKPEKSHAIQRYCDFFWLVAEPDIATLDEIPQTWGWLERGKGKLVCKKPAPELIGLPPTKAFFAAVMRSLANAQEQWIPRAEIQDKIDEGYELGKKHGEGSHGRFKRDLEALTRQLENFEQASGVKIDQWAGGSNLGHAVKLILHWGPERVERQIEGLAAQARRIADQADKRLDEYRKEKESEDGKREQPVYDDQG